MPECPSSQRVYDQKKTHMLKKEFYQVTLNNLNSYITPLTSTYKLGYN